MQLIRVIKYCCILLVIVFLSGFELYSQSIRREPSVFRITMSAAQTAVDDWKVGNIKTIEFSSSWDLKDNFIVDLTEQAINDTLIFRFNLKFAAGMMYKNDKKNALDQFLPTDNIFGSEGVLVYPMGWKLDPFFSASFFSQITESFIVIKGESFSTANLWDPVTSQQSWGFEYNYKDSSGYLFSRIGFSLKQIRAYTYTLMTDDPATKDIKERYKPESGIQWKSEAVFKINPTLDYKATLDLFGTFKHPDKWTVTFQNEFKIKLWELVGILVRLDIAYDEKQAMRLQFNQSLRFGIIIDVK